MKRFTPHSSAVAALASLLCTLAPAPAVLAQQATDPKTGATPKLSPAEELLNAAEADFSSGKFGEAVKKYQTLLDKYGSQLDDEHRGAVAFRRAGAVFLSGDWAGAEVALKEFLEKYPKGTGDILVPGNNMRGTAQLSLAEAQAKLKKYDEALAGLRAFTISFDNKFEDKVKAWLFMADLVETKAAAGKDDEKKAATKQAIEIVKQITQNSFTIPEVREAAYKLVGLYTKAGMVKEATLLRKELEAKITNPADLVRANFLKFDLGDRYFKQAEDLQGLDGTDAVAKRNEFYKQAIAAYQGVHRRKYIEGFMETAVQQAQARFDAAKQLNPPTAEPSEAMKKATEEVDALTKIKTDFEANKSYDAQLAYRLGLCLTELKRPWEARVAFKEIVEKYPEFEKTDVAYYYYIVSLNDIRRYKDAQAECKKFLEKFPQSAVLGNVAVMLGDISVQQEEYRQAIENFRWARINVKSLSPKDSEYIDAAIVDAFFRNLDWTEARKAIDNFRTNYPSSLQAESMNYMRALTYFYEGDYKNTVAGFEEYTKSYPNGLYTADVAYRYALVVLGVKQPTDADTKAKALDVVQRCERWLAGYAESSQPAIINQRPEVINLKADALNKIAELKSLSVDEKKTFSARAIDAYIETAKNAGGNKQVLEFALRELNKTLPARGEWDRLRDIYDGLYKKDPKSPEALGYLYWKIKCTEKLGKTPEERLQRSEEAKTILAEAVVENLNDVRQDNVESLVIELANKLAREVKRREKMNKDKPGSAEPFDANAELEKLLKLKENRDSLIAQARGYFAKAEIAKALKNTGDAKRNLDSIANQFKPDELSPTILALVGEHLMESGKPEKAVPFFTYLKESYRGSQFADFGFAGLATILLDKGKAKEALPLISDALENGIAFSKERDLRFLEARALLASGDVESAKKSFNTIAAVKEWRGETTAGCLYYLGRIEEQKGNFKEAVNFYNRCYLAWKKYEKYAVPAIYRSALLYADKLNQKQAALDTLKKELFSNDNARLVERYKTTPEWTEAEKLRDRLK